ncbi:hypothetical protein LAG90_15785 [Marinilongibacter aquaticus]|uniref:hypothetical protein n=1 Tax=Marinilongibacter aquaticus TaxID=2975157 RepID=UPI0021BD0439|nr:hypothetical protein [Marinilongibacter aquaticus]UBM58265.1 hypothetical protein LAG90_15785 [Marinilongibacter aquaticus]
MILGFKTMHGRRATLFPEKIMHGLLNAAKKEFELAALLQFVEEGGKHGLFQGAWRKGHPKLHTFRTGKRWKAGDAIHFAIRARTKKYFQFAPVMRVKSVQDIEIRKSDSLPGTIVKVDGRILSEAEVEQVALNDGFHSLMHFWVYFEDGLQGQIVHWTDLKY